MKQRKQVEPTENAVKNNLWPQDKTGKSQLDSSVSHYSSVYLWDGVKNC